MRVWPGQPYPLGATWDGRGVNFAIYSEHATKVELCLFDSPDATGIGPHHAAGKYRPCLARFFPRSHAGATLWLSRSWALRAGERSSLQRQQDCSRPIREIDRSQLALGRRTIRLQAGRSND